MEDINIYDDVSHVDLGTEILKLEDQNKSLLDHIRKLEGDIIKLCGELTNMKEKQQNLSRNISELYKTAKLEIQRKERIIADLQQEVDDLKLGRKQNPQRYKRQFPCEKDGNEPPKRFKNNFNDNETTWKSEKKECSLPRSLPENNETYQTHDVDMNRVYRDYRNDETNRNSRYPSSSVRGRNRRNYRGRNNNRYGNRNRRSRSTERFRRSRSLERFRSGSKERDRRSRSKERDRRSRSKDRDRRSNSNEKDRRSRSIDQFSRSENQNRRRENTDGYRSGNNRRSRSIARQNSRKSEDPSSGIDVESYSNLRENFVSNNDHRKTCIEVLDLANDSLEDGEISSEGDNLIIEEDVRNAGDKRIASLPSKRDMKSISIEEYRNRNKSQETETVAIESDINIRNAIKTELLTVTNDTAPINCTEPKLHARAINLHEKSENATTNNATDFSLRTSEAKTVNHIVPKSITKEANDISLDDSNSGLKSTKDSHNSSVNSNNSSFANNSGNISNVSNTTPNGGVGPRRRRCVVIGLKEKA